MEGRLLAILDRTRSRRTVTRATGAASLIALLCLVVPLATARPTAEQTEEAVGDEQSATKTAPAEAEEAVSISLAPSHAEEELPGEGSVRADEEAHRSDPGAEEQVAVGVYPERVRPGETFRDCPECPEMVVIPAGEFVMGSPEDEEGRYADEGPQHGVRIAKPFAVGRFEVTGECERQGRHQCNRKKDTYNHFVLCFDCFHFYIPFQKVLCFLTHRYFYQRTCAKTQDRIILRMFLRKKIRLNRDANIIPFSLPYFKVNIAPTGKFQVRLRGHGKG